MINKVVMVCVLLLIIQIPASADTKTIAFIGDANPTWTADGKTELTKDLNQIVAQSPNKKVDAIVFMGDMSLVSMSRISETGQQTTEPGITIKDINEILSTSVVRNIPAFWVVGNHETEDDMSMNEIKRMQYLIPIKRAPNGTDKTSYSFNIGDLHVVNINQYWDGGNDGHCAWYKPTRFASDDSCFKYSESNGGYIPLPLMNWIKKDLITTKQPWKIVLGHEPMYPQSVYIRKSLDQDSANRDALQTILRNTNTSVYLAGHTHYANVTKVNNIYHIDTGAIGTGSHQGRDPFATITYVTANSTKMTITVVQENPTWNCTKKTKYTLLR